MTTTAETCPDSWLTPTEARASRADALTALRARPHTLTPTRYQAGPKPLTRSQRLRRRRLQQLARAIVYGLLGSTIVALAWAAFTLAAILQNHA